VIVLDSLRLTGGSVVDKLLKPLVAIVLLYMMVKLPTALARMAMVGGQALRGGFVARTAGYTARRRASNAVEERLDESHRSHTRSSSRERNSHAQRRDAGPTKMPVAGGRPHADGGTARWTGGGTGPGPNGGSRPTGYVPPQSAQARTTGHKAQHGLPTPAFRKDDFEAELFEAEHRERNNPVSPDQARAAAQALPANARHGIAAAASASSGDGARRELAYRTTAGEWSPGEREALRTLAAATPEVRSQALTMLDEGSGSAPASPGGGPLPAPPEGAPFDYGREASSERTAGPEPGGPTGGSSVAPREQQDRDSTGASSVPPPEMQPREQRDPGGEGS
jgi:hypothetical protein